MDKHSFNPKITLLAMILLAISGPCLGEMTTETKAEADMIIAAITGMKEEAAMMAVATLKCSAAGEYCHATGWDQCCSGTKCIHYNHHWGLCVKK